MTLEDLPAPIGEPEDEDIGAYLRDLEESEDDDYENTDEES